MAFRVCLVTTGQPATNPRAAKEADALSEAGYDVHMIAAFAGQWAVDAEPAFMTGRRWSVELIDWRREADPQLFWRSGLRHRAAQGLTAWVGSSLELAERAIARPAIELRQRALEHRADLYIAHNLGALPAAARAAARYDGKLGFDAEDFHSGQFGLEPDERLQHAILAIEHQYLPRCHYVTASSPGIAAAYQSMVCDIGPRCILNVASLRERVGVRAPRRSAADPLRLYWFSQTIGPGRGLEDVVQAMATLPDRVELHVRGAWADGYEHALRGLAQRCGVASGRIVGHRLASPEAMVQQASQFDIGLALEPGSTPNNRLAISNKIFTYLMAGLPVVMSLTPGQAWLLGQAEEVGWGYCPGDARELSVVLGRCLQHPDVHVAAGAAASRASEVRFCWDIEQQAFLEVVDGVLSAGRVDRRSSVGIHPLGTGSAR